MARWTKHGLGLLLATILLSVAQAESSPPSLQTVGQHASSSRAAGTNAAFILPTHFSCSNTNARGGSRMMPAVAGTTMDNNNNNKVDQQFIVVEEEEEAGLWSPRSRHWINDDFFQQDVAARMGLDLERYLETTKDDGILREEPVVTTMHRNKAGNVIAVEVASALTEKEAAEVKALAQCARDHVGESQFENRSFGDGKGGNDCTYLAPLLQVFRPDIASTVVNTIARRAWEAAEWGEMGHPDPRSLGIRTSEHLLYNGNGGWRNLEAHKDDGSIYTTMISLADPSDYGGGAFFFQNSFFESTDVKLSQLSAIVFLSDTTHGVRPITSGCRETFVTELWTNEDAPLGMTRPTPQEWEAYIAKQEAD